MLNFGLAYSSPQVTRTTSALSSEVSENEITILDLFSNKLKIYKSGYVNLLTFIPTMLKASLFTPSSSNA